MGDWYMPYSLRWNKALVKSFSMESRTLVHRPVSKYFLTLLLLQPNTPTKSFLTWPTVSLVWQLEMKPVKWPPARPQDCCPVGYLAFMSVCTQPQQFHSIPPQCALQLMAPEVCLFQVNIFAMILFFHLPVQISGWSLPWNLISLMSPIKLIVFQVI